MKISLWYFPKMTEDSYREINREKSKFLLHLVVLNKLERTRVHLLQLLCFALVVWAQGS